MSSSATKRLLSGSTDGKAIKVAATSTPGTTIHTAVSGTTAGTYHEIWLWAYNHHTANVDLTIEFGGTTSPDNVVVASIPFKQGLVPVIPGFLLQNGAVVKAFAATGDVVTIMGFVNSITD